MNTTAAKQIMSRAISAADKIGRSDVSVDGIPVRVYRSSRVAVTVQFCSEGKQFTACLGPAGKLGKVNVCKEIES